MADDKGQSEPTSARVPTLVQRLAADPGPAGRGYRRAKRRLWWREVLTLRRWRCAPRVRPDRRPER